MVDDRRDRHVELTAEAVALRADKHLLSRGARQLRHAATQDAYQGWRYPENAYALASVLETFELQLATLDVELRATLGRCCRVLLDEEPGDAPDGQEANSSG